MDRMKQYLDRYGNPNNQDRALGNFQQTTRDSYREERERQRREEERRRAEERRKREQTKVEAQAVKEIAKNNQEITQPVINQPRESTPYKSSMFRNVEFNPTKEYKMQPYLEFNSTLKNDLNTRINAQKALGMRDADIEKDLIPPEDNTIKERLEDISSKLREGKESIPYNIKEGWYEREVQNMLSKEYVRQMNGLPNNVDIIEDWLEANPEIQQFQTGEENTLQKFIQGGTRFLGSGPRLQYDSYMSSLSDPMTYVTAGLLTAAAIAAAPVTGGASLAATPLLISQMPLLTKTVAAIKPLGALTLGMKGGALKNMAELEGGSAYREYLNEGIDHRIAAPMATTVGAINGLIEYMQIDSALSAIPGVTELMENGTKKITKEFAKEASKVLANYGVDLASNVIEEMAQAGTTELGLELSKYLQDAPDPSTIEGLKVLAKTMTSEDFRNTLLDEGYGALQSMWLSPIVSSAGRVSANRAMQGMVSATKRMQVQQYLDQENKINSDNTKATMDYVLNDEGITDQAIRYVNERLDPQAMAFLASEKKVLEDLLQREDVTNQDKERVQKTLEKINTVLSKVMYDEKDKNPDIEYKPTNRIDVEEEMLSDGWLDEANIYNKGNLYNYNIELYKQAKEHGILDTIKEGLKKGTNKAEIIRAIEKRVPKKERKPVNLMSMINSVEVVNNEIEMQIIQNQLNNILEVQANHAENVTTEATIKDVQEENETVDKDVNIDTPQSTTTVDSEVVQGINQPSSENLAQENVVAENVIQEETTDKEVKEEEKVASKPISTEKYQSADIKTIPINTIHVDPERFQFRYDKGNAGGATNKFANMEFNYDVTDPILLWEDEYGDLYVVNGHHRVDLAKNSNVTEIDAKIITHEEYTADQARALGAMKNIAEDNASSIDVAKLIRDTGTTDEEFTKMGVRPNSKIKKDGIALANLNDWIFTQVATKGIPIERAIIIGRELGDNPDGQDQIIKAIDNIEVKGKSITNDVLTELIAEVKGTAREEFTEMTLFGEETFTKNFSIERAELVSYVKSQLKGRVSLLKNVSKNKNAAILQELGNTIAVDDNVKEMNTADQALFILDKTLNYQGTKVNELFNRLAREYADADNKASVKKKALNELISLMESGSIFEIMSQQVKKADVIDNIQGQATFGITEQELEAQEELIGQETMMQLKGMEEAKIVADEDAKQGGAFRATSRIVEAIKNNPIFNGLTINYSNESGKVANMSKEDLIKHGYGHLEEAGEKTIYGFYNDRDRTITLNREATRDTILEEAIHDIQHRLQEIDPSLAVLVSEWESEVREQALQEGITIPEGYELLAQALVYTEYGYASTNPFIANLIAVDDEIVDRFTTLLGSDIAERGFGFVESEVAKEDRQLRGKYEEYADRIFKSKYIGKTMEAKKARATEIVQDLENTRASQYYQPYTNQYVIVGPSTKDGKYQITYFHPEFGPVSDSQHETTQEVADRLVEDGYFYKTDEIHYQLKNYDRSVVDELYRSAISRGYRTNNSGNGQRISFGLSDNQIIDANFDAKIGNFLASDFDELIKDNKEVLPRVKNDIIKNIIASVDKGLDVPNSEISFIQYLNRFHDISLYDVDSRNTQPRTYTIRYNEKTNKIEFGSEGVDKKAEREFSASDEYDTLEDAIKDYKNTIDLFYGISDDELNKKITPIVKKDFMYMVEMLKDSKDISEKQAIKRIADNILGDYKEFKTNIETYRHKGLNYNFDMKPHYAISYEAKKGLLEPETLNIFGQTVYKNPNYEDIKHITDATRPFHETYLSSTYDKEGNVYYWDNSIIDDRDYMENIIAKHLKVDRSDIGIDNAINFQLKEVAAIDTPEFKKWFKDSKVVDQDGNPLVVYHGSPNEFDVFSDKEIGNRTGNFGLYGKGFYFTSSKYYANLYGDKIKEVYLNIQNPFIVDANVNVETISELAETDIYNEYPNPLVNIEEMLAGNEETFSNNLQRLGYDGVIVNANEQFQEIVVFNPTQIKSIYNNGMFNEYDPNINYQLKETEPVKPIVDVPGFYSNLENVINTKMGKRAKASDLINMLTKNGVKPEEMEWFEIASFLEGKDFVYKEELLEHMGTKRIEFSSIDMGDEFESYTLDGGDNYRFNAYIYKSNPGKPFVYQPHFGSVQNVIAHTRYKDRVGSNGEKILFIEELQSDWHQKGRQEGYLTDEQLKEYDYRHNKYNELVEERRSLYEEVRILEKSLSDMYWGLSKKQAIGEIDIQIPSENKEYAELENVIADKKAKIDELSIEIKEWLDKYKEFEKLSPDAPLKESVTDFMLKTAIKDAVEGGYDYIAWTTGTQQADRYNIGNWVSNIGWRKFGENNYNLNIQDKQGNLIYNETGINAKEIGEVVGNGIAKQIVTSTDDWGTIEGDNLHVGGEFHKKLYDNYIPRSLRKYGKKWGVDVSEIDIENQVDVQGLGFKERIGNHIEYLVDGMYDEFYDTLERNLDDVRSREIETENGELSAVIEGAVDNYSVYILLQEMYEKAIEIDDYNLNIDAVYNIETGGIELQVNSPGVAFDENEVLLYSIDAALNYLPEDLIDDQSPLYEAYERSNLSVEEFLKKAEQSDYDTIKQPMIPVTPKMIEEVMTQGQPLFQLKEEPSSNGSLLAMHNIDKNKLKNAIKLGGFPMPSIAVAKKDLQYTDFGNITLLFNKDTIDPQASKLNKVYSGDAYTPVFPTVYHKINEDVARKINNMVYNKVPFELRDRFGTSLDEDNIGDMLDRRGSFKDAYSNDVGLMIAYLNEKGIPFEIATTEKQYGWDYELLDKLADKFPVLTQEKYIDMNVANEIAPELTDVMNEYARETFKESFPDFTLFQETMEFGQIDRLARNVYEYVTDENRTVIDRNETEQNIKNAISKDDFSNWLEEISEGIIEKTGFRNDKDTFTPSGNRRKWETLHEEVTLDNVVRAMKKEPGQAAAGSSGIGQFMAVNSQEFKSLQHIRDSIDMLVDLDPEEFKELREEYANRLFNIANKIKSPRESNQFMALDSATDILIENIRDHKTKSGIIKALQADEKSGYISLSNFSENELFDLIDDVKEMPTQYFEAKPRRAVRFNEVQAALIDESRLSGEEELTEIKDMLKSVGVNVIETYSEDNRQQAMDSILRQNDVSFQLKETDTTTPAFKNWFKDSKVVDEEGQPLKVYHGTPNEFDTFSYDYLGNTGTALGYGFYFAQDKDIANMYTAGEGNIMETYVRIKKPLAPNKITITKAQLKKLIKALDPEGEEYLSNYGDVSYEGFDKVLNEAISNLVDYNDSDVDIISDVINSGGYDVGEFYQTLANTLGHDGIIHHHEGMGTVYIPFSPTQIKSVYNQGTWKVNDPNIYYQLKEEPTMEERSWGQTVRDANLTTEWLKELLTSTQFMYEVKHNEDTLIAAAKLLDEKGEEYIEARLLSDIQNDTILFAASQMLTYKYMENGEQDRAMNMIEKTAEKATSMGQAIQILSVWGRQTPEGMLRHTYRIFSSAMTEKQKAKVATTTQKFKSLFNELNKRHIRELDLVGTIDQLNNLSDEDLLREGLRTDKGKELVDKYGVEGVLNKEGISDEDNATLDGFLERTDINTQQIVDIIQKHYTDGTGSLKKKLTDAGMNDLEADMLSTIVKENMKNRLAKEVSDQTNKLSKKDYEREGIDEQLLDKIAKGEVDEDSLRSYIAEKEGLPIMNKELVDYIYQQGKRINEMEQGRERDIETAKLIQEIMSHTPVSIWEKLKAFRFMSMLLNFKTTTRNLIGNDMFRRLDTFTLNFLGTPIDKLLAMNSKQRTQLFRFGEYQKYQRQGYKEHWQIGLEDALLGIDTSDMDSKFELRRYRTFDDGILGKAETAMAITMRATDKAAAGATIADAIQEQYELAELNGIEITEEVKEKMAERAAMLGAYRTFNDETAISKMASGIQQKMNIAGFGGEKGQPKEFGLGHVIMPFPKTPSNIMGRAVDYSPMGLVVTMFKLYNEADPYTKQRAAVEGVSRALMGTGLIATGALLARLGVFTGSNPDDDEDIYKLEKAYGLRDFSINTSAIARHILSGFKDPTAGELRKGDTIASYDWAEPIAMPLAVGADTELGKGDALSLLSTIIRATEAGATALTDQPLLSGIADLFRYGDPIQGLTQTFKRFPSSFTPSLLAHVAQFMDGRDTDPYSFYDDGRQAWNLIANRTPILREGMPQRHTVLGDPKYYTKKEDELPSRLFNSLLNPAITSKYMPPEEAELLFDLYDATEDADIVPRPPQKSYTIDKVKYTFTPESWEEMSKWLGSRYKSEINRAMNTYMRGWSTEEQVDEIKYIIRNIKNEAKEKVVQIGTVVE